VDECHAAIEQGYRCFEDLKRFLGVGTGPCQGKSCVQAAMRLVAEARGIPLDAVDVMTFRPPVRPIAFETLAAEDAVPEARSPTPSDERWGPDRHKPSDLPSPERLPGGTVRPRGDRP
jgi:bacterioferritin-associated ferredoxin